MIAYIMKLLSLVWLSLLLVKHVRRETRGSDARARGPVGMSPAFLSS